MHHASTNASPRTGRDMQPAMASRVICQAQRTLPFDRAVVQSLTNFRAPSSMRYSSERKSSSSRLNSVARLTRTSTRVRS